MPKHLIIDDKNEIHGRIGILEKLLEGFPGEKTPTPVEENYDIAYTYTTEGDIKKETITGDINRTTFFTYFTTGEFVGNVEKEVIVEELKTITKTYSYETGTSRLLNISVVTGPTLPDADKDGISDSEDMYPNDPTNTPPVNEEPLHPNTHVDDLIASNQYGYIVLKNNDDINVCIFESEFTNKAYAKSLSETNNTLYFEPSGNYKYYFANGNVDVYDDYFGYPFTDILYSTVDIYSDDTLTELWVTGGTRGNPYPPNFKPDPLDAIYTSLTSFDKVKQQAISDNADYFVYDADDYKGIVVIHPKHKSQDYKLIMKESTKLEATQHVKYYSYEDDKGTLSGRMRENTIGYFVREIEYTTKDIYGNDTVTIVNEAGYDYTQPVPIMEAKSLLQFIYSAPNGYAKTRYGSDYNAYALHPTETYDFKAYGEQQSSSSNGNFFRTDRNVSYYEGKHSGDGKFYIKAYTGNPEEAPAGGTVENPNSFPSVWYSDLIFCNWDIYKDNTYTTIVRPKDNMRTSFREILNSYSAGTIGGYIEFIDDNGKHSMSIFTEPTEDITSTTYYKGNKNYWTKFNRNISYDHYLFDPITLEVISTKSKNDNWGFGYGDILNISGIEISLPSQTDTIEDVRELAIQEGKSFIEYLFEGNPNIMVIDQPTRLYTSGGYIYSELSVDFGEGYYNNNGVFTIDHYSSTIGYTMDIYNSNIEIYTDNTFSTTYRAVGESLALKQMLEATTLEEAKQASTHGYIDYVSWGTHSLIGFTEIEAGQSFKLYKTGVNTVMAEPDINYWDITDNSFYRSFKEKDYVGYDMQTINYCSWDIYTDNTFTTIWRPADEPK